MRHDRFETEVLIVGAGPSGGALAVWLAERGVQCLLVDRARFPRRKPCASCFSPRCFPLLKRLGLEDTVRTGQQLRYIEVQSEKSRARFDTLVNPLGPDFYVFPRLEFDRLLVEKAKSLHVPLLEGVTIEGLTREGGVVTGACGGGMEFRARVTVIATGAFSRFLPASHRREMRTYQTLIGWYEGFSDLDPAVTDSFTAPWLQGSGWIFPESPQRVNVGVMVHERLLRASGSNLRGLFEAYCASPFVRERLQGARRVGALRGSPIRYSLRPEGICADGFLMVGEACLLTHPLTGEGISQALRSAALAAEVLAEAHDQGAYNREVLRPYESGVRRLFRLNFRKGAFLRGWLDRPAPLEIAVSLARSSSRFHGWVERKLHRIVL
jgi:menaquinone-9 beta-reductase